MPELPEQERQFRELAASGPKNTGTPISTGIPISATDLRVLCALSRMVRGVDVQIPLTEQMGAENMLTGPDEMFVTGNVTLSRRFIVEMPPDGQGEGRSQEVDQLIHFSRVIPHTLLALEVDAREGEINGALIVLEDRGLIASRSMDLSLPVGRSVFRSSNGTTWFLEVQRLDANVGLGDCSITVYSDASERVVQTASRMKWFSMTPKGWELVDHANDRTAPSTAQSPKSEADVITNAGKPAIGPGPVRRVKPSHAKARALYEWAMGHIDGAETMTYAELFEKLSSNPQCAGEALPDNAEAFGRYCRAAGFNATRRAAKKA
jgi:hypothetical protein